MPKHDALTPKAIGNRIKAKGLQKLRWYCQMCAKQCRDENGFKCHTTSESHLRQMRVFSENPDSVMEEFSQEFEEDFIEVLSRRFGTKRTHANQVYNEFIAHKSHTHMNATKWETLTNFVKYLGKTGQCIVDETEKGWYIQWINRDPALLARQAAADKKRKADLDDDERQRRALDAQVAAAHAQAPAAAAPAAAASALNRLDDAPAISLAVTGGGGGGAEARSAAKRARPAVPAFDDGDDGGGGDSGGGGGAGGRKKTAMELVMEQEERKKAAAAAAASAAAAATAAAAAAAAADAQAAKRRGVDDAKLPNWLHAGIVVKVMNKQVGGGKYYKAKGVVRRVIEDFIAEVKMVDGGDRLRVDQDDLETVIPALGKDVLIVNGRCRGSIAELLALDVDNFCARVRVVDGPQKGTELPKVDYENISKLAE
ncbi:antigenic determinant of recA protein [Tribonema minus]|uniref:Antigenic determinant of recA protein n=1 Tax=Tribonema minus TaxID=303371 RepID=A0A835Z894_9STRA|nr:antigenic determinant of recA protein [Tribonema minus]